MQVYTQGRGNNGRAGEAVKKLRAIETYEKTNKSLPICFVSVQN